MAKGYFSQYYKSERKKYADAIINSSSRKKIIVAGPGTGKTFIFQTILKKHKDVLGDEGLALTFIRNLVADLKIELGSLARVSTFHAFCKSQLHFFKEEEFEYYPDLFKIIEKDFELLGLENCINENIERCFFSLKNDEVIKSTLKVGDYYNASSHSDSVYRVIKYFEAFPDRIPIFPLIVVDEYQDFNFLETRLIDVLSNKSPVLIVGDDDQALYAFKQASVDYIRRLTKDPEFQRFELPYCSRCTKVIVEAVNKIVSIAIENGRLKGRVNKLFKYFPPDKELDSKRHPKIVNVKCTVERKNCHYMGKFIAREVSEIPISYIKESKRRLEPTVLVIGPGQFLRGIEKELKEKFEYFQGKKAIKEEGINILDGYKSLTKYPTSRLGWRIVLHCDPCDHANKIIKDGILDNKDIDPLIPSNKYKTRHIKLVEFVNKIMNNEELNIFEQTLLEESLGATLEEIRNHLLISEELDSKPHDYTPQTTDDYPEILCTSFEGSKGLAAQYVFIVGFNKSHFPQNIPPSNRDICRLIVALTRTRKKCYVISCNRFAGEQLYPSIFSEWLRGHLSEEIYVDKNYIKRFCL